MNGWHWTVLPKSNRSLYEVMSDSVSFLGKPRSADVGIYIRVHLVPGIEVEHQADLRFGLTMSAIAAEVRDGYANTALMEKVPICIEGRIQTIYFPERIIAIYHDSSSDIICRSKLSEK